MSYRLRIRSGAHSSVGDDAYIVGGASCQVVQHHGHCRCIERHLGKHFAGVTRFHLVDRMGFINFYFVRLNYYISFEKLHYPNYNLKKTVELS